MLISASETALLTSNSWGSFGWETRRLQCAWQGAERPCALTRQVLVSCWVAGRTNGTFCVSGSRHLPSMLATLEDSAERNYVHHRLDKSVSLCACITAVLRHFQHGELSGLPHYGAVLGLRRHTHTRRRAHARAHTHTHTHNEWNTH